MSHNQYIRHASNADLGILFIHGFLGSPKHFNEFIRHIPENVGVYNILLEGHNGTVTDFGRASMEKWKTQVDSVVRELIGKYPKIIIVAHSMGTFFAMEAAIKYPDKIKGIMLMQPPLQIGLKASAPINTIKSFFNKFSDDPVAKIYNDAHSVKLNLRIWEYIPWLSRYLELFRESKKSREVILKLKTPTYIFQAKNDELVSMRSVKFIPDNDNICLTILNNSAHFIYDKNDFEVMLNGFMKMIEISKEM